MEPSPDLASSGGLYSPYQPTYSVRVVEFPNGAREASLRVGQRYVELAGEAAIRQKRLANGFRPGKRELSEGERERKDEENRERSVRRAKKMARYACVCLGADHLVTLTYRENMQDFARAEKDWDWMRRLILARYPEWRYVAVMELQERGAIHFHVAVKGRQDINYLRTCWYRVVGEANGQVNVRGPKRRWAGAASKWRTEKLAGYISKYMAKSFHLRDKGSKRYWASKDIAKPKITRLWIEAVDLCDAIVRVFGIVAGTHAVGVRQWLNTDGSCYWVGCLEPPRLPF